MRITPLSEVRPERARRVAVGEFDGVHLGHRAVISGSDTVLTFEPHPLQVVRPEAAPRLLTSLEQKAGLLEAIGVRELVLIEFDAEFAQRSAQAFVDEVLVGRLAAERVSVGANFRFGHRAEGDTELLRAQDAFSTRVVELVEAEGEIISSSHIRGLVLAGEVDEAARFLGHPFEMRGQVVHGDRRGRELGYPTANLVPDERLVTPGHGVYAAWAGGIPAAVSVGVRPTFGTGRGVLVEAYLIDWDGDLYGRELRMQFLRRLRGERAFATSEELVAQMARDVQMARATVAAA